MALSLPILDTCMQEYHNTSWVWSYLKLKNQNQWVLFFHASRWVCFKALNHDGKHLASDSNRHLTGFIWNIFWLLPRIIFFICEVGQQDFAYLHFTWQGRVFYVHGPINVIWLLDRYPMLASDEPLAWCKPNDSNREHPTYHRPLQHRSTCSIDPLPSKRSKKHPYLYVTSLSSPSASNEKRGTRQSRQSFRLNCKGDWGEYWLWEGAVGVHEESTSISDVAQ